MDSSIRRLSKLAIKTKEYEIRVEEGVDLDFKIKDFVLPNVVF